MKPGDTIYLRYHDSQNTFPGHGTTREERVFVRTPTEGKIRIVETRIVKSETASSGTAAAPAPGSSPTIRYLPPREASLKGVAFEAPFTVEVIDPDSAKDSRSQVIVELQTSGGEPIQLACRISSAFGETDQTYAEERNPALFQGRFVGQVLMRLGGPESPQAIPIAEETPLDRMGSVRTGADEPDNSLWSIRPRRDPEEQDHSRYPNKPFRTR